MRAALLFSVLLFAACVGPNETHPGPDAYVPPQQQPLPCLPNLDGTIALSQLQPAIGATESFLVSPAGATPSVDLVGAVNASGQTVWDWSAPANDQQIQISPAALGSQYYAGSFPGGQFTLPYDAAHTLDAVYSQDASNIYLLGLASSAQGQNGTLLVYQQPVAVFRFPLQTGESWTSVGQVVNGMLEGLPYAGTDTYDFSVDAAGILELPDLTFQQALRVRTHLTTVPVAGTTVTRWQVSFLFQCFGEVARATSLNDEPNENFTTAAEIRRLGLSQ